MNCQQKRYMHYDTWQWHMHSCTSSTWLPVSLTHILHVSALHAKTTSLIWQTHLIIMLAGSFLNHSSHSQQCAQWHWLWQRGKTLRTLVSVMKHWVTIVALYSWCIHHHHHQCNIYHCQCQQLLQLAQLLKAGWVSYGQKWKTVNGTQYFADIIDLSSTTMT